MRRKELQALLDRYIAEHFRAPDERLFSDARLRKRPPRREEDSSRRMSFVVPQVSRVYSDETWDFDEIFKRTASETFSEMLLRLIKDSGRKPSEIYRRADVDRQTFHKIKADKYYHPSRDTAIAFAIALKLDLSAAQKLLETAGYAFSNASMRDVIISCFIEHELFSVTKLNQTLFDNGEDVLFKRE